MNEPTQAKVQPIAAWKTSGLDVTVWEKKNEHGTFYNIKAVHRFKRKNENKWDETSSFDYAEIPMLIELLNRALATAIKVARDARLERLRYQDNIDSDRKPAAA